MDTEEENDAEERKAKKEETLSLLNEFHTVSRIIIHRFIITAKI